LSLVVRSLSTRFVAVWWGLVWLTWLGCGIQRAPGAHLAEVDCGAGRCFDQDARDRVVAFGPLSDSCARSLLTRQATLVGMGEHIVLSGLLGGTTLEGTAPAPAECADTPSDEFVAHLHLSVEDAVELMERDAIAEQLGVARNAARVMADGSYVVFAGDSNRTDKILWQPGDGWRAAAVEAADADTSALEEPSAPTAQAISLSDGRTLVVRPPGPQGRRLRLEGLRTSELSAVTIWPPSQDAAAPKAEGDLLGDVWNLRVFEGGAVERILFFGGGGNPVWFSTTKPGFVAEAPAGVGTAWQASSIVPLPQFQASHGYPAGSLLIIGGAADDAAKADLSEARLQLFDPVGNRWLAPSVPLPWPLLHTSPVLLPDGSIALVGGQRVPAGGLDAADTRVIYLYPNVASSDPPAEARAEFSVRVGHARLSRLRGQGTSAMLLPSGAIFIAGGQLVDGDAATENADYEVLEPPYLAAGLPRPLIRAAPASLTYADSFALDIGPTSNGPATVVLMAFGSANNGRNVTQRHLQLAVESVSPDGRQLLVRGPDSPRSAPPGRYLLFVVDAAGVPSPGLPVGLGDAAP